MFHARPLLKEGSIRKVARRAASGEERMTAHAVIAAELKAGHRAGLLLSQ
jgi:hypothetical protein